VAPRHGRLSPSLRGLHHHHHPSRAAGKLKPEEFQGGSFTISNLGMFGIDNFTAVINPPQAAILAVGGGAPRPLLPPIASLDELDPTAPAPEPELGTLMAVQLSADARVLDAAGVGAFLQAFRHYAQNPALLVA
jgi:pyruvate dehydrogenase E2 component (dihydrolipoamide acetyltransferase)